MSYLKNKFQKIQMSNLWIFGVLALILLAVGLLWFNESTSVQSYGTIRLELYFVGEYSIDGGPWNTYVAGEHIPATQGDVTFRGNFYKSYEGEDLGIYNSEDLPIAFYIDHINLTFAEVDETGEMSYIVSDIEDPAYGDSGCGKTWTAHHFASNTEEPIEILVHNPHSFGNETAIDEMFSNIAFWSGIDFEKEVLNSGGNERNIGLLFAFVSIMLFSIALFSTLIHIKKTEIIWALGAIILFAGIYFAYSSESVSLWSHSTVANTTILGTSMMLYMLFFDLIVVFILKVMQKVAQITVFLLGAANAAFFVVPIITDVLFYDTWIWWIAMQFLANIVLAVCLIKEFVSISKTDRWMYICALLPMVAFGVDSVGTWLGAWRGGLVSKYVFMLLFVVAVVIVLKLIPENINAAAKAKELEMEKILLNAQLSETRISTMMSQIRPHFIYNTLGSIEQLCKLDPTKAGELVHNFAKYLRGNFGELDNPKPILMSQEMEHVHHYISIENVRFPDMTFTFEMNSDDFHIPALTVQPIVENAIKHGLMKLPKGGTINVVSYENDENYFVSVVDDGAGFDTNALVDERRHLGLRNIRERLKVMVNGTLEIESTIGVGTKVLITIPKEAR